MIFQIMRIVKVIVSNYLAWCREKKCITKTAVTTSKLTSNFFLFSTFGIAYGVLHHFSRGTTPSSRPMLASTTNQ